MKPLTLKQIENLRLLLQPWDGDTVTREQIDALCDAAAASLWVPVADLPADMHGEVLAAGGSGWVGSTSARQIRHLWATREQGEECYYTHWMPLPLPPLPEQGEK